MKIHVDYYKIDTVEKHLDYFSEELEDELKDCFYRSSIKGTPIQMRLIAEACKHPKQDLRTYEQGRLREISDRIEGSLEVYFDEDE